MNKFVAVDKMTRVGKLAGACELVEEGDLFGVGGQDLLLICFSILRQISKEVAVLSLSYLGR